MASNIPGWQLVIFDHPGLYNSIVGYCFCIDMARLKYCCIQLEE